MSCREVLEGERRRCDHVLERVHEKITVLPAIEPERHFVEIGGEMFRADLMPCTDDAALQQREGRLNRVGVDDTAHITPIEVSNRLVPLAERVSHNGVRAVVVRDEQFYIVANVFAHELAQRLCRHALGAEEPERPATLPDRQHGLLVLRPITVAAYLATDIGFVDFDDAAEFGLLGFQHRGADSVAQVPCGLVTDAKCPLHLIGREAFTRFDQEQDGGEPCFERQVRIAKDVASGHGELVSALALPLLPTGDRVYDFGLTTGASDAIRPTQPLEQFTALLVGGVGA